MMRFKSVFLEFLVLTFGSAVAAAAIFFFMLPSRVTIGSVSALAMVLSTIMPVSVSVLTFAINAVLLLLGYLLVGREFGIKTVYSALLLPVILGILEKIFPNNVSLTDDPFLDTLCYVIVVSVGMAILFTRNASSGGMDIVAKIMNKYLKMDLGNAVILSGMAVALTSIVYGEPKLVILAVLGTYFNGLVVDYFIFGINLKRRVCIISQKETEIRNFILHQLHSGATIYQAIGAYDDTPRREIIAIVNRSEYLRLMRFLEQEDPNAFTTVYAVNEVKCRPKTAFSGKQDAKP